MTPAQRATLSGLADALIPGSGRMPAASAVGVSERRLDRVLASRPDLAAPLSALLDAAAGCDPREEARRLRRDDEDGFTLLLSVVTAAYYGSPKVRRLLGYPGQRPHEVFPDQAEHDLRDGILEPVVARGPIWRPAPLEPGHSR